MEWLLRAAVFVLISLQAIAAHARTYNQGELDALLAPVALYPDPLLTHVLNAAAFPQDVASAAAWRRDNPHHSADQALRDVEGFMWHPSVKALVAQPDVLSRLAESPDWLAALGEAYLNQAHDVQASVQQLRMRAQSSGALKSDQHQQVYQQDQTIVVQPVYPNVVYAPYYNPYIVYGGWWWPAYRPVFFRPWIPRPVYVTHYYAPVVPLRPVVTPLRPVVTPLRPLTPLRPVMTPVRPVATPVRPVETRTGQPLRPVQVPPAPQSRYDGARQLTAQRTQAGRPMPAPTMQATPSYRGNSLSQGGGYTGARSFSGGSGIRAAGGGRHRS